MQSKSRQGELFSDVEVTRSGERLQLTPYERAAKARQFAFAGRVLNSVEAGKNVHDAMTLNKLFDLNKAGRYTAQVRYRDDTNPAAVGGSNTATFDVK